MQTYQLGEMFEVAIKGKPFDFFRRQYHIITDDHKEKYYSLWIDYLLDNYSRYRHNGFNDLESQAFSLSEGLEALLK